MSNNMEEFDQVVEKLPKLFDTLGDSLPKLMKTIKDQLFSPEAGKDLGKAVGSFYKELADAGIDKNQAVELTKEYMRTMEKFANQMKIGDLGNDGQK